MADRLAILAGAGALPRLLAEHDPAAFVVTFAGTANDVTSNYEASFEKLGGLFKTLRGQGVSRVCFGGGLVRPALNPLRFDATMLRLAPRLMAAMKTGDDAILRLVVEIFEDAGFEVVGAHDVRPDLLAGNGLIAGPKPKSDAMLDIARAHDILAALSPLDVGQGCVVAGGLCHGIETLQGTDALLDFVANQPLKGRGVLLKRLKIGQETRIDMPTIGPRTLRKAAASGLAGICVQAGGALIVERPIVEALAKDLGVFVYGEDM